MHIEELLAREAIRKTVGLYTSAVDRHAYEDLRLVFASDAVLRVHNRPELRGVEQIIVALEAGAKARNARAVGNFQRHNITSSIVAYTSPSEATATHYVIVVTELGFDHIGRYVDAYRRVWTDWVIESREATLEWVRPDSRFAAWLGSAGSAAQV